MTTTAAIGQAVPGPVPESRPMLELRNVEVTYHRSITAVQGISISVQPHSITGIVGTNGAGKTTTLSAIAGFLSADDVAVTEGVIEMEGQRIDGRAPHAVARAGIGLVPERNKIFSRLTVEENLRASVVRSKAPSGRTFSLDDVYDIFPVLGERRRQISGYLSGGERQQLAMGMGLLGGPRILLIDEMSLGLSPAVVVQLSALVRRLRDELGLTVVVVEQNAVLTVALADYVYVMENGRVVFEGDSETLMSHRDFREFYLGIGADAHQSYRDVKEYRRKRRW